MLSFIALRALMASTIACSADSTATEAHPLDAWNSPQARYGARYDRVHRLWLMTQDGGQGPTVYRASGIDQQPLVVPITSTAASHGLGYITCTDNGEAYGVAYVMGERQPHATIVRVFITDSAITVGDPVEPKHGEWYSSAPSISPDGSRIVFTSDRPGGAGGTDLWFIERMVDGAWSAPQVCSDAINSPKNETTPHFLANDTLLYSSDGFGGQGGMDVFVTVYRDGIWQDPVPLELVNSPLNETDAVGTQQGGILFLRGSVKHKGLSRYFLLR